MTTKYFKNIGELIVATPKAESVANLIDKAAEGGKFFSCKFIKKDGSVRDMTCRLGVVKHLRGGDRVLPQNYIVAFDVNADEKGAYRAINPETVLAINGQDVG